MRKLAKAAFRFLVISAVIKGVAHIVSRAFEGEATASDDDFKLLAVMDGREFDGRSTALRTGSATALMGGIDIDLTRVELDPGGAHVALKAVTGGIRLTVPTHWRIDTEIDSRAGGVEVRTPDPVRAADDAPRLTVEAYARMGGILIQAED